MGSRVHQLATTATPQASFVVHQPYLFPVDGQEEEAFLVICDDGEVKGRRRGKRGRVQRIDGGANLTVKADSAEEGRT